MQYTGQYDRRAFMRSLALGSGVVLLPGFLAACSGDKDSPTGPGTGTRVPIDFARGDVAVLQLAWVVEQLHADFYRQIVPYLDAGAYSDAEQFALTDIKYHHVLQREYFRAALGADADFTLRFSHGTLDFADRNAFLAAARVVERRGVGMYNGLAPYCSGAGALLTLGKIASVGGRHGAALAAMAEPSTTAFAPQAYETALGPESVEAAIQGFIVQDLRLENVTIPVTVVDPSVVVPALQFVLLLKRLQAALCTQALQAAGFVPAADAAAVTAIRDQATVHTTALLSMITARGTPPADAPTFDFTARGAAAGFTFASNQYTTFLALSQAIADLTVRALKGRLADLRSDASALTFAMTVHTVDAAHAAQLRRMRGQRAWITGNSPDTLPAFLQSIYAGEEVVMQGTVNVSTLSLTSLNGGVDAATQAFDEPLAGAAAAAIVAAFVV